MGIHKYHSPKKKGRGFLYDYQDMRKLSKEQKVAERKARKEDAADRRAWKTRKRGK